MSNKTDGSVDDARHAVSPQMRAMAGMIRRVVVNLTSGAFWQVTGHLLLDQITKEIKSVEVWPNIGFYARPIPGANAEALMVAVAGAENPALIATRDEDMRKLWHQEIGAGCSAMFNRVAGIVIKPEGPTVEIASLDGMGTSGRLATLEDLQNVVDLVNGFISTFNDHIHGAPGGPTDVPTIPEDDLPNPVGTQVLRAE